MPRKGRQIVVTTGSETCVIANKREKEVSSLPTTKQVHLEINHYDAISRQIYGKDK